MQAERVAAFYTSWKQGEWVVIDTATTIADGLAARSVFKLPYVIMKDHIADVVLLSEEEILDGIRLALGVTHNLAEGAGAASLAAAVKIRDRLAGKKVALVMSGGNLDHAHLLQALAASGRAAYRVSANSLRVRRYSPQTLTPLGGTTAMAVCDWGAAFSGFEYSPPRRWLSRGSRSSALPVITVVPS